MKCPKPNCNGTLTDRYEDNYTVHVYFCSSCHYENRVELKASYVDTDAEVVDKNNENQRKTHFI